MITTDCEIFETFPQVFPYSPTPAWLRFTRWEDHERIGTCTWRGLGSIFQRIVTGVVVLKSHEKHLIVITQQAIVQSLVSLPEYRT